MRGSNYPTQRTLWILQGIPGSGKSTLAKMIADKVEGIIFSTDDFWWKVSTTGPRYEFNPAQLEYAHRLNQQKVRREMQAPDSGDIIVDNTNITRKAALPYFMMAQTYGYQVVVVRVQTNLETCIERNNKRPTDRQVPEDVIHRMASEMEDLYGV